jgi:hypothetical protein
MTFQQKMVKGRALLDKHGLSDWSISIENLNNVAKFKHDEDGFELDGGCIYTTKTIYIDTLTIDFKQTVLHEIAHALTPECKNHGKDWRTKLKALKQVEK